MKDTHKKSLTESALNVTVGVVLMFGVNLILLPLFGMPYSVANFGLLAVIQISIGFARSYTIRRLFVQGLYESVANFATYVVRKGRGGCAFAYAYIVESLEHAAYVYTQTRISQMRQRRHY